MERKVDEIGHTNERNNVNRKQEANLFRTNMPRLANVRLR